VSTLSVEFLAWDSQFFGLRIGRLSGRPESIEQLQDALVRSRQDRFDCIYALVPADEVETNCILQRAGFVARDVRLDFSRPLDSEPAVTDTREWNPADLPTLEAIAETAFGATRFAADPGFTPEAVRNLYRTWISNSCKGYAEVVVVAGPVGSPHGFITLHRDAQPGCARIGLIGVASAHRSQGIGSQLIAAALGWAKTQGCSELRVSTQAANVGAQRLYQRTGFTTVSASTWFHYWSTS